MKIWLFGVIGVIGLISVIGGIQKTRPVDTETTTVSPTPKLAEPAADFRQRITKKPFGIFITRKNSPIQPERFSGYHTGADAEYTDITADVPVYAIADGEIVTARTASGYGGVMVLKFMSDGQERYAVYGHVRPASMKAAGMRVSRGEQIAVLGNGYSKETDGERKHLHLGIANKNTITGYVTSDVELKTTWMDPVEVV